MIIPMTPDSLNRTPPHLLDPLVFSLRRLSDLLSPQSDETAFRRNQLRFLSCFRNLSQNPLWLSEYDPLWRSLLCTDETPVELSVSVAESGNLAVRYVCDARQKEVGDRTLAAQLRTSADHVVPNAASRASLIDEIFDRHLTDAPADSLFWVLHGAGMNNAGRCLAKLYFNVDWVPPSALIDYLKPFVAAPLLRIVKTNILDHHRLQAIGYDFDETGLVKIAFYVHATDSVIHQLEDIFRVTKLLCGETCAVVLRKNLLLLAGRWKPRALRVWALGVQLRSECPEVKVDLKTRPWGWKTFKDVNESFISGVQKWPTNSVWKPLAEMLSEVRAVSFLGEPLFEPTWVGVGVRENRLRGQLYFKPREYTRALWPDV